MREEASIKEWGRLYEAAARIKERKPWEQFWDMDLIAIRQNPAAAAEGVSYGDY